MSITPTKASAVCLKQMKYLQSDETKVRIIKHLRGSKGLTLNRLRTEIGSVNFVSVKRACLFLERLGILNMESRPVGERHYIWVRLTDLGEMMARKL